MKIKNKEIYNIYVDGSYCANIDHKNFGRAGYGFVVVKDNKIVYEKYGRTNKIAESRQIDGELKAAKKAMKWLYHNNYSGIIYCDFIGIQKWFYGDWTAVKKVAQEYIDFCDEIKDKIDVKIKHVKGHSGNKWNDYADKLAENGKNI